MAFTEEQENSILETMQAFKDFMSKQNDSDKKEPAKDLKEEARENLTKQTDADNLQRDLENALGFNMKIGKFADDYKGILPETVASIISTANGKTYSNAIAKADEIRKSIIDEFISNQSNIDNLPESLKNKVLSYKDLTEDAKAKKSASYWDIVEIGAEMQSTRKRAEALKRANNAGSTGDESAWRTKFFNLRSEGK